MKRRSVPQPRTVELAPLSVRADVQAVDDEARTVNLVFSTGAGVERFDWARGERYLEVLSLEPEHVRLDRLNAGGPLLDAHSAWSVSDILGAVVPGSVELTKKEARAQVRFSKRDSVEPVWQDVRDKIIRSVSVGYRVHKFEETKPSKGNAMPIRRAIDWEPFEVSMVPIPADAGATTRNGKGDSNQCVIVPKGTRTAEDKNMRNKRANAAPEPTPAPEPEVDGERDELLDEGAPEGDEAATGDETPPAEPTEGDVARTAERKRCQGIMLACRVARLPQSFADKLINDGLTLEAAQSRVFEELQKREAANAGPGRIPSGAGGELSVGDGPQVHERQGIKNALLHRIAPSLKGPDGKQRFALDERGRRYRGMSLLDVARVFVNARGIRTSHMNKMDLLSVALGPGAIFVHNEREDAAVDVRGLHTTSDFALLLADVQGKVLRAAYEEAPQTWAPLATRRVLSDFKPSKQLQLGEAPALLEVLEHGEFTRGTITEGKEQFQLSTYGRVFGITRQALINDDLDAFSRIATAFGRAARQKESDLAWQQITANGLMGDGVALFDAATHANLTTGPGTAIDVTSLGVGRAALRKQKGLDGATLMNLSARFLIVPAGKETLADQFTSANYVPAAAGSVNPFAGRLQVIAEPRLDVDSATSWYLAASPDQIDLLYHGVLEGQEGPAIETRVGFDVDGLEIKCRLDAAFKTADFRGLYKNTGA